MTKQSEVMVGIELTPCLPYAVLAKVVPLGKGVSYFKLESTRHLGQKADLVLKDSLKPLIKDSVLKQA